MRSRWWGLVPLTLLLVMIADGGVPATGDAVKDLQVFDAQSAASPIAVVSRVPAESDGGFVFASSHVEIGKSQATAAGVTLGPLADAFLITSVKGYANPTYVTAQYPPSPIFPSQATASTTVNPGPITAATFHAVADSAPSATADAIGASGGQAGVVRVGAASSHSDSRVSADGTVVTTAVSTLHDISIGPNGAPVVSVAAMTSTATVKITPGGSPSKALTVEIAGMLAAGVPVNITQNGLNVAGALPVPATGVATVDAALAQLASEGITISAVPVTEQATAVGATISGAALEIGYQVPTALLGQLPTDIGTNETIRLGDVTATATSRPRRPLTLQPPPAASSDTVVLPPAPAATGNAPAGPIPTSLPVTPAPSVATPTPAGPPPTVALFTLPRRTRNLAADRLLLNYRIFIIAGLVTAGALLLCRQTRLID